jgi:hypothetical protein
VADQGGFPPSPDAPSASSPQGRPQRAPADRKVEEPGDWAKLKNEGLTSVIDPALVRVADLFLRGRQAANSGSWAMIRANLASLVAFVDSLVLEPGIPVFDYWYTFFQGPEFSPGRTARDPNRIFAACGPVIVPVSVGPNAWAPLRTDVFAAMQSAARISDSASANIENNLKSMRWKYDPLLVGENLAVRRSAGDPSGRPLVNSYLYVALLFLAYAAQFGGTQLLSPEQSDALLLASAGDDAEDFLARLRDAATLSARQPDQGGLFDKLNEVIGDEVVPVTIHRPCFLPYLIAQGARTPAELFGKAIEMRERPEVRDYRAWMRETESDLAYGRMTDSRRKEINTIAAALRRRTEPTNPKASVGVIPSPSAAAPLDLTRARDWLCSSWPGKRYRRLIQRLAISKKENFDLTQAVRRIWTDGDA